MAISPDRNPNSSPLTDPARILLQAATQIASANQFCQATTVIHWALQSEYEHLVKGKPGFDEMWDLVLEMPPETLLMKARLLLPFVVAEGGDIWSRLKKKYDDCPNDHARNQLKTIYSWLHQHKEIPAPDPSLQDWIAEFGSSNVARFQVDIFDDDGMIIYIFSSSLLLSDQQLECIWDNLKARKMDSGKAQILLACLWFFPPHFWRNRTKEFIEQPFSLLPPGALRKTCEFIVRGENIARTTPRDFNEWFSLLRPQHVTQVMKALFNLLWAKKDELSLDHAEVFLRNMETPLELREMALYINENYEKPANKASTLIKKAYFKDVVANYLSEPARKFILGKECLDSSSSEVEILLIFDSCRELVADALQTGPSFDKRSLLERLSLFSLNLLWLERRPRLFLQNHLKQAEDFLLFVAMVLARIDNRNEQERRIYLAFVSRAKSILSDDDLVRFESRALSLTNNHVGEALYRFKSIFIKMDGELTINGDGWFKSNLKRFEAVMEDDALLDEASSQGGTWSSIPAVYKQYVKCFPKRKDWIVKAIASYVKNHPVIIYPEEFRELLAFLTPSICSFDLLRPAAMPGSTLLALLRRIEEIASKLPENALQKLFDWSNLLLRKECDEVQFWIQAQKLIRSIAAKIPKGRGKRGIQFTVVWNKFQKKIAEAPSPEELMKSMIERKRLECFTQFVNKSATALGIISNVETEFLNKQKKVPAELSDDNSINEFHNRKLELLEFSLDDLNIQKEKWLRGSGSHLALMNHEFDALKQSENVLAIGEKIDQLVADEFDLLEEIFKGTISEIELIASRYKNGMIEAKKKRNGEEASFVDPVNVMVELSKGMIRLDQENFSIKARRFEVVWADTIKMNDVNAAMKARMLASTVINEGASIWERLLNLLILVEGQPEAHEIRLVIYHLLNYKEVPRPAPLTQSLLDEKLATQRKEQLLFSRYEEMPELKELKCLIPWIIQFSHLLPDDQLELVWSHAQFTQMDQSKAQLLLICIQHFPPHFWKEKREALLEIKRNVATKEGLYANLWELFVYSQAFLETPNLCRPLLESLNFYDNPLVAKGVFNLLWAHKDELTVEHLITLLEHVSAPIELSRIALHINARHESFSEEAFRQLMDRSVLIDSVALYLSDSVLERYFGDRVVVNAKTANVHEVFEQGPQLLRSINGDRDSKLSGLRELALFTLFATKTHSTNNEAFHNWIGSFLCDVADKLVFLRQTVWGEKQVFAAFLVRAQQNLDEEIYRIFIATSLSLSNNFYGERTYHNVNILFMMAQELQNGTEWFSLNQDLFIEIMERENLFEEESQWPGWEPVITLYQMYQFQRPDSRKWLPRAIVAYVNQENPWEGDPLPASVMYGVSITLLNKAVKPGRPLIELLGRMEETVRASSINLAEWMIEWAKEILKQSSDEAQVWHEIDKSFQALVKLIPEDLDTNNRMAFQVIRKAFKEKINNSTYPAQIQQLMVEKKRAKVNMKLGKAFFQLFKEYETRFLKVVEDSDYDSFLDEKNEVLNLYQNVFRTVEEERVLFERKLVEQSGGLKSLRTVDLKEQMAVIASNVIQEAEGKIAETEQKITIILNAFQERMEFKILQKNLLDQPIPETYLMDLEAVVLKHKKLEELYDNGYREAIVKAESKEELKEIQERFAANWSQIGVEAYKRIGVLAKSKIPVQDTREARKSKHQQDELERLKEKLRKKKESKAKLKAENARLKQRLEKSASPEIKEEADLNPLRLRLIEKLREKSMKQALRMIEVDGKYLRSISKIVKFLALFQIYYRPSNGGNHKVYTDGQVEVVISNHDGGESRPVEKRAALEAALAVVSRKEN